MEIQLSACSIRSLRIDDAPSIQRYADNRKIWQNLRDIFPHPYRLRDAESFIRRVSQESPSTVFAIATPKEAIGCIGLQLGEDVHRRTAELGYWLAEPFWGHGIVSQAVVAFTAYAFDTFPLDRVFAQPFATNRASIRVLEKAGFALEGCLRFHVIKDGKHHDALMYAKLRPGLG